MSKSILAKRQAEAEQRKRDRTRPRGGGETVMLWRQA